MSVRLGKKMQRLNVTLYSLQPKQITELEHDSKIYRTYADKTTS